MSQFSAVLLIHTNGVITAPDQTIEVDGQSYFIFTVRLCKHEKEALDAIAKWIETDVFIRKLLLFKAVEFAVLEQTDDELGVKFIDLEFIEKDKILYC